MVAVLLGGAFPLQSRDAVKVRDGVAKIKQLLADSTEVAGREVPELSQLDELLVRERRLEHPLEEGLSAVSV